MRALSLEKMGESVCDRKCDCVSGIYFKRDKVPERDSVCNTHSYTLCNSLCERRRET